MPLLRGCRQRLLLASNSCPLTAFTLALGLQVSNASLDAIGLSRRATGVVACSLQWPLVGGAGMGAEAFARASVQREARPGSAGVSLEQYAVCLKAQLAMPRSIGQSVELVHRAAIGKLLDDLSDRTQPRFAELTAVDLNPSSFGAPEHARSGSADNDNGVQQGVAMDDRKAHLEVAIVALAKRFIDGGGEVDADTELLDGTCTMIEPANSLTSHVSLPAAADLPVRSRV